MSTSPRNRRRTDPDRKRESTRTHPGSLFFALVGVVFVAYVFDVAHVQRTFDSMFRNANVSLQSHNDQVVQTVLLVVPYAGIALLVLALYGIARMIFGGAQRSLHRRTLADREALAKNQFVAMAAAQGIRTGIGQTAYRLLLPFYHGKRRATLDDTLVHDLRMGPAAIASLHANLLRAADRRRNSHASLSTLVTVLDLLKEVQASPTQSVQPSVEQPVAPVHKQRQRSSISQTAFMEAPGATPVLVRPAPPR